MDDVSSETALRPGLFEGLDADACARLRRCGIDTVLELAQAAPLELARAGDLSVPAVTRWQGAARRAPGCERVVTVQPAPRFSPAETGFHRRPTVVERELEQRASRGDSPPSPR